MTHERIKGRSSRYFGILAPIETLLFVGLMPLLPRQYLFRRVEEGRAVALDVLNRWFFQDTLHRYDFRDIQAITVRRSRAGMWMSVFLALFSLLFGTLLALAAAFQLPMISQALLTVLATFGAVFLLFNLARGTTCVCEIHTRVNKERLYGLGRWRSTIRVIEDLCREIGAAQGAAETPPEPGEVACGQDSIPEVYLERLRQTPKPTMAWHRAFFALMLVLAASSTADLFISNDWKNLGDLILFCVQLLTGSFALTQQHRDGMGRRPFFRPVVRRCTSGGLAALLAILYGFTVLGTIEMVNNLGPEMLAAGPAIRPGEVSIMVVSVLNIAVFTPLGVLGLWGLANPPQREVAGQEPPNVA